MDKKIIQAANSFRKQLRNKTELKNVISLIERKGYRVVFFNTNKGDVTVKAYNLEQQTKCSRAFTYVSDNDRIVFLDNNAGTDEKLRAILHEAGHIELGHFTHKGTMDRQLMEAEAYSFMLEVLNPKKPHIFCVLTTLTVIIFLMCGYTAYTSLSYQAEITQGIEVQREVTPVKDYVYITRTGKKYHKQNCNYIINKDCAKIEQEQAEIIFLPCNSCNP